MVARELGAWKAFPALPEPLYVCLEKALGLTLSQFLTSETWLITLLQFKGTLCVNIH